MIRILFDLDDDSGDGKATPGLERQAIRRQKKGLTLAVETATGLKVKAIRFQDLCFSCDKEPMKYITGLCQGCSDIANAADEP